MMHEGDEKLIHNFSHKKNPEVGVLVIDEKIILK
jgi:hypothetical protein